MEISLKLSYSAAPGETELCLSLDSEKEHCAPFHQWLTQKSVWQQTTDRSGPFDGYSNLGNLAGFKMVLINNSLLP